MQTPYRKWINIHRQLVIAPVKSSKRTFGRKYASFGDFTQVSVGQRFTIHRHAEDIFKRCERAFFMLRKSPYQGVIKPFSMRDMGFSAVQLRLFRNRRLIFRPHNDNFPFLPSDDKACFRTDVFLFWKNILSKLFTSVFAWIYVFLSQATFVPQRRKRHNSTAGTVLWSTNMIINPIYFAFCKLINKFAFCKHIYMYVYI